jgi:hypothetical protein
VRDTSINVTTSSIQGTTARRHPDPCPPPAHLLPDHVRVVARAVYESIVRLLAAEADQRGFTDTPHPHATHGRELDDLYEACAHMSHRQRLARLGELGERTDDLELPEPTR